MVHIDLPGIPVIHEFYIRMNMEECVRTANDWVHPHAQETDKEMGVLTLHVVEGKRDHSKE